MDCVELLSSMIRMTLTKVYMTLITASRCKGLSGLLMNRLLAEDTVITLGDWYHYSSLVAPQVP